LDIIGLDGNSFTEEVVKQLKDCFNRKLPDMEDNIDDYDYDDDTDEYDKKFGWDDDDDNFDLNKDDIGVNNIDDDDETYTIAADDVDGGTSIVSINSKKTSDSIELTTRTRAALSLSSLINKGDKGRSNNVKNCKEKAKKNKKKYGDGYDGNHQDFNQNRDQRFIADFHEHNANYTQGYGNNNAYGNQAPYPGMNNGYQGGQPGGLPYQGQYGQPTQAQY